MKAIVTGHSRGLGEAVAQVLLSRGIAVLGLARRHNMRLAKAYPELLQQEPIDLADAAALDTWLATPALKDFITGAPQVLLVNNAGTVHPVGAPGMQTTTAIAQAVALNIAAPLMLTDALVTVAAGAALRIMHVSSGAGRSAYAGWSVYCATKAALDHHARAVQLDRVPNLRLCSLAPGIIDTDMQADIRAAAIERFPMRGRFEQLKKEGLLVAPDDCARRLVDYLLAERFGTDAVADLRES